MARDAVHRVSEMIKKEQQMRLIFIRNNYSTLLIWVGFYLYKSLFSLQIFIEVIDLFYFFFRDL